MARTCTADRERVAGIPHYGHDFDKARRWQRDRRCGFLQRAIALEHFADLSKGDRRPITILGQNMPKQQACPQTMISFHPLGQHWSFAMQLKWRRSFCENQIRSPTLSPEIFPTSSTGQGGGGSFKDEKHIGQVRCCEWWMAENPVMEWQVVGGCAM